MKKPTEEIRIIKSLLRDVQENFKVYQNEIRELKIQLIEVIKEKEEELIKSINDINDKLKEIEELK